MTDKKGRASVFLFIIAVLAFSLVSCGGLKEEEIFGVMDTDVVLKAYGRGAKKAIDKVVAEIKRLDGLLNAFSEESIIGAVNAQAGIAPVKVPEDVFFLIKSALEFADLSGGAFDPTVMPLVRLWGFGSDTNKVPQEWEIQNVLHLVDYRKVVLDEEERTVFLEEEGMALDLGAIAKGYAVERMQLIMEEGGVKSFLINAGGNVYAGGVKPEGSLWNVAVTDPLTPEEYLGVLSVKDTSLVSSGDYQRFFELKGVRYHHILDPKTGYPARKCHGTTVILPSSKDADALSTAFFVLGPEGSQGLLAKFPDAAVLFVEKDGKVTKDGIVDKFQFK